MVAGLFTTFLLSLSLSIITALAGPHASGPFANRHHGLARRAEGNVQLYHRGANARFSFYVAETGNAGSCGSMLSNSGFTVAMNVAQMQSGWCFKTISISYNGKSTTATIEDTCPGCPFNGLDMTQGLFDFFADASAGIIYGEWEFAGAPAPAPAPAPSPTPPPPPPPPPPSPTPPPPPPPPSPSPSSSQSPPAISSSTWIPSSSQSNAPTSTQSSVSNTSNHTSSSASSSWAATPSVSIDFSSGAASGLAEPTGIAVVAAGTVNIENLYKALVQFGGLVLVAQDN